MLKLLQCERITNHSRGRLPKVAPIKNVCAVFTSGPQSHMKLDLAIINAKLWSPTSYKKEKFPTFRPIDFSLPCNGVAVSDGVIVGVGTTEAVLSQCSESTRIIDANGGLLIPGFTDAHVHFLDGGLRLLSVQLRNASSREQFRDLIAAQCKKEPKGTWILGGDWDHYKFNGELPTKEWIDAVSPEHPVWVNRMDGHMSLANSVAMHLAGVNKETPDVPGGTIIRDAITGEPTGVFKDNATNYITEIIPKHTVEKMNAAVEAGMNYMVSHGVTKVHTMVTVDCACGLWPRNMGRDAENQDMEVAYDELAVYQSFAKNERLKLRIRAALPLASWKRLLKDVVLQDRRDKKMASLSSSSSLYSGTERSRANMLQVGCLKAMIDGSLGTHTAAFLKPYTDSKAGQNDCGHLIWDPTILEGYVYEASSNDLQVMVHAIGDRGNRVQLDIFEKVSQKLHDKDLRFRIEHAQHIAPVDIPRFGQLGVIASMQLTHLADDGRWCVDAIGHKRMQTSWPMRSLLDSGAVVALGSDWFVTDPNPLNGIYDAVTRRTIGEDSKHFKGEGLVPEEKVSVEEALCGYTIGPAYAAFEEHLRGSLDVGKLADLTLLDRDILEIPIDDIKQTKVLATIVGGEVVYEK